jgi:hypothetical protein
VNRDQWNVDDELSRLKDEIKNDMGQRRGARQGETTHYGPHQHIEGRGNVQVAGDLIFTTRKPIDPNHPDAIRCPKCKGMTYSFSELCYECNFNQKYYFIEQARKWEKKRLINIMFICGALGLLIIFVGNEFFTGAESLYPLGAGGLLLAAAYFAEQRIDQISTDASLSHRR